MTREVSAGMTLTPSSSQFSRDGGARVASSDIGQQSSWDRRAREEAPCSQLTTSFHSEMVSAMPQLRLFAVSLSKDRDRAEDLVQETFLRALNFADRFDRRGKMLPWLKTILRNQFYTEQRKRRREVPDGDGEYARTLVSKAEQPARIAYGRVCTELLKLPADMRDALILVGINGVSYDDAATEKKCLKGTMKTRIHRARARLAEAVGFGDVCHEFTDDIVSSVLVNAEGSRSDLKRF